MIKIKDNIDLKELEKYGFKKHKHMNRYELIENFSNDNWDKLICSVNVNTRVVFGKEEYIQSLIKDGLVVEKQNNEIYDE